MIIEADSKDIKFIGYSTRTFNYYLYDLDMNPLTNVDIADAKWRLAKSKDTQSLVTRTLGNGITINGNVVSVKLRDVDTKMLSGRFIFQLELTDAGGHKFIPDHGYATIKRYIRNASDLNGNSLNGKYRTSLGVDTEASSKLWKYLTIADLTGKTIANFSGQTINDSIGEII